MHKPGTDFDAAKFLAAIEKAKLGESFRSVALDAGVSPSTFTAITQGRCPDVISLGRLLQWLGEEPFWMTTPK